MTKRKERGVVTKTPEEMALDKAARERERATTADPPPAADPVPADPAPVADPPPAVVPSVWTVAPLTTAEFACQLLMAQTMTRLARDAGITTMSEAAAQAVIMRGFELGIPPLRALTELYLAPNDTGGQEFVMEAGLMRARVAERGLGVIEPQPQRCTAESATVRAMRQDRFGWREESFTYTLEEAKADGLLLKSPRWQSGANRPALLVARATALAYRSWFEDCGGPRYTPDEFGFVVGAKAHTPPASPLDAQAPASDAAPVASPAAGAAPTSQPQPPPAAAHSAAPPPEPVAAPVAAGSAPLSPAPGSPPNGAPGPDASRQEKLAYYAQVAQDAGRAWTVNAGMSRDPQPVPILTHGVQTAQLSTILDHIIESRRHFARAEQAMGIVIDHLGKLGIDTSVLPVPYCLFSLTVAEAGKVVEFCHAFAAGADEGNGAEPPATTQAPAAAPSSAPAAEVRSGQEHSWQDASAYLDQVLANAALTLSRGDALTLLADANGGKTLYELTPDELWKGAQDLDRLAKNPGILTQAIQRMRMSRGA